MARVLLLLIATLWVSACAAPTRAHAKPRAPVVYRVSIPEPHTQYVEVEVDLGAARGSYTDVALPAWTPGSYLIRDYAKHVYAMRAETKSGKNLQVESRDKQTWRVHHGGRRFALRYRVFAADRTVRTSHVDDNHASLNGASVFVYAHGQTQRRCKVEVRLRERWNIHTALSVTRDGGVARVAAADYDELVDSPIELGRPRVATFEVDGVRFEFVLTGGDGAGADLDRLVDNTQKIVTAFGEMMGGFPMRRYVFFLHITDGGGGGLEHADSTMMMMSRDSFDSDGAYDRAARLVAHEFFHLWNVKRIHDVKLGPFDYSRENHSELLWFHEGVTETAESMALLRSGLWSPAQYLRAYAKRFTALRKRPGRNYAPLTQMSHQAWTKGYKPEPNHRNVAVSYYAKGDLVGLALDLEIRKRSSKQGKAGTLMGVFRRLMITHANKGRGITHADLVDAASAEAGENMEGFFERFVRGLDELELDTLVAEFGVGVKTVAPWENLNATKERAARAWIGVEFKSNVIRNVEPGSPADRAKLMRGDEIVAISNRRTEDRADVERELGLVGPGNAGRIHFFRGTHLHPAQVQVEENPHRTYHFKLDKSAPKDATALRKGWLGG